MEATLEGTFKFNPADYSERVLRLIMAKAETWKCSPGEALTRLLENAASRAGFPPPVGSEGQHQQAA